MQALGSLNSKNGTKKGRKPPRNQQRTMRIEQISAVVKRKKSRPSHCAAQGTLVNSGSLSNETRARVTWSKLH